LALLTPWLGRYKTYILILICTIFLSCNAPFILGAQASLKQADSADSFVDKMGVVVHLTYKDRVYYTGYETIIKPRLLELGLRHARDGAILAGQFYYDRINELGRAGIKFNFSTRTKYPVSDVIRFAAAVKDGIESFEGLNEYDLSGDPNWANTVRSHQQSLYQTVKGNSSTAQYPVLAPSIVNGHALVGDISAFVDYGNAHNYFGGNPPSHVGINSIEAHLAAAAKNSGSKPIVTTETGWHNALGNVTMFKGAPEQVTGKYVPRTFLEHFNKNSFRTYAYELIDQGTDQNDGEKNFGLLRNDGSPKPAYTALKNLVSLLKDPGPSFSPSSLDYTLSGSTADVHKTLLQKRDGKFYLILWVEKRCYDPKIKQLIAVPSQQVTLKLKTPISMAVTYLPNTSINGTIQSVSQQKLVLQVPDHPLVVELTPARCLI